ncbi:MAG: BamA/TamA family outer membrane protein [Acidobacteria bacterium]|nr:BamA/TamA family outer membrane protein [Acidobacteriota bacterium]
MPRPWPRLILALVLGAVAGASAQEALVPVATIELRSDVAVARPRDLLRWVAVEVGQPLRAEAVARSLRNLHAAGIASRIEVYRLRRPDGLAVVFVLRGKTLIERVEWVGELGLKERRIREAMVLGEGEPLLADRIFRSFYQLRDLYEAEGFLDASVRLEVKEDEARRRAIVTFRIDSGEPSTVGAVEIDRELATLDAADLRGVVDSSRGRRYRATTVRDDRERLENWLLARDYRQAIVTPATETRHDSGTVDLVYPVALGPHFSVEMTGAALPRGRSDLEPLRGSERYDEATIRGAVERIVTGFQERGYYEVEVEIDEEVGRVEHRLEIDIASGTRRLVRSIEWRGNEFLSDERLQAVMRTSRRAPFSPGSGRLVDQWLEEDLVAIRALYALEGFSEADVGPAEVGLREADGVEIVIPIVEGRRRLVLDLSLSGARQLDVEQLLADLPLEAGGPYHLRREEEALDLLRSRYEEAGFNLAQVTSQLDWSADGSRVSVSIEVLEGPQSFVERVIVRGPQRTDPRFVRRVLDLEAGTPLSQSRMLELQRRLYGLGIFSQVDVSLVPGTPYSGARDVMVQVREGRPRRLSYGLGYDSEDGVRGLLGYSHANLWGRAMAGRVDLRLSQRDQQARVLLRQPQIGRFRWPLTYSLFSIEEEQESFRSLRRDIQVQIERQRRSARWGLLSTYRTIEIDEPDPGLELLLVDRAFQEVAISSLTPSLFVDHRDDVIDPRRGWSATLSTELAFPAFDADEEFTKVFAQHTRYFSLGRAGVLAASLRAGAIEPRGRVAVADPICEENGLDLASCAVNISERFFAGGRTTHRAYRRDRLGVLGSTLLEVEGEEAPVAIGGTGLALANFDYRFPIGAGVGGILFVDGGNLWADWRDASPADLEWGAGVGVRYSSPIGPIRLEVGWKLDRQPGESAYIVLFSFGNPF